MQVAIVTSEYGSNGGGLSYSCETYARLLKAIGINVIIVSSIYDKFNSDNENFEFPVIQNMVSICEGGYKSDLKNQLFFRAHLSNVISKIIDSNVEYIIAFGAGLNGLFASELAKKLEVELVLLLRGSEINLAVSSIELRQYNYSSLKMASKIIALSHELLERSKEIFFNPSTHYVVIPNIIKSPDKYDFSFMDSDTIVLGCGSRYLNEKKGISNLITMLRILNEISDYEFYFEFVGEIDCDLKDNYMNLIKNFSLEKKIKFYDGIERKIFIERMKSWDFYVQGSFCEGFSNSVADYLSLGKKFILSNSGFIAETIKHYTPQIIFDNFNPEDMAKKVSHLLNLKNIDEIYSSAYEHILENTDQSFIKSKWKNIFGAHNKSIITKFNLDSNIVSLVLHDICTETNSNIDTKVDFLLSFVTQLANKGYVLCSAKDYFLSEDKSNLIVCTFDDGYKGVIDYALPIFRKYNFTASVFICYNYMGKDNKWNLKDTKIRKHMKISDLQALQKLGWEVGSHGCSHRSLLKLSDIDLKVEIRESKKKLHDLFGEIKAYSYPYGDYNEYCKSLVKEEYQIAFALSKGGTMCGLDNHQIRRYFISELINVL